jgi:hypothetical protein
MKLIIAALVAAGLNVQATAEESEILTHLNPILAENKRLKTENEAHLAARKARVTALLETAVTDKVIVEARKANLLALGTATAEGETEVFAQISELRAAVSAKAPRGAKPAKVGEGEDPAAVTASRLEEIQAEMKGPITAEKRSTLTAESLKLRGMDNLFAPVAGGTN